MSEATDPFPGVSKDDLAALCIFLAGYQDKLQSLRGEILSMGTSEEVRQSPAWQQIAMHWPVIQGSRNQFALSEIGKLPYDSAAVSRAIHFEQQAEPTQP